jgi:hypothetical protein
MTKPVISAANVLRQGIALEISGAAPGGGARFIRQPNVFTDRVKGEYQIVMQVVGLAAVRGDSVHVQRNQARRTVPHRDAGLLENLAAGGVVDLAVPGLDVAAGEQPAIEAPVVYDEETVAGGLNYEPRAGDVPRRELMAGEGLRRGVEEEGDEFAALHGGAVGGVYERVDEGANGQEVHK